MDLNELLHRQQISLMRADRASCAEARFAHKGLARGYGDRITRVRAALGAIVLPAVAAR